ncbi:MAG: HEPN domain-containing protein [Rhizobacter sp.]|nr:HEPN domain-containing protein [Chlorobiales bacterium]
MFEDAANRAYYSAFHAAIAALAHAGILDAKQRNNHKWVAVTFVTELIHRRKIYPNHYADYLETLRELREVADYQVIEVGRKRIERQLTKAKEFFQIVQTKIQQ